MTEASASSGAMPSIHGRDIMNDSAFDPAVKGKQKGIEDLDTCRICRGEGSAEEPLFYPCKCSGSIKFVHQKCLMEWLSHSHKKHCELCKTPFRFTKLYHPHMPNTVPSLIFLRQAAVHGWKSLLAWSRMHLVIFVWLFWLPWSMRTVWRGLFWVGDGGWINWQELEKQALSAGSDQIGQLVAAESLPASHGVLASKARGATSIASRLTAVLSRLWLPASQNVNQTNREFRTLRAAKIIVNNMLNPKTSVNASATLHSAASSAGGADLPYRSSWLSDVGFLKSLTRSSTINNLLIDTLEGQLITLMIVIAFILVFLIREWVIQQQPALNIRGAGPADRPNAVAQNAVIPQGPPPQPLEEQAQTLREQTNISDQNLQQPHEQDNADDALIPGPSNTSRDTLLHENQEQGTTADAVTSELEGSIPIRPTFPVKSSSFPQRPGMPSREVLAQAAELRRTMEEQYQSQGQDWPGVKVFKDLWIRAESRPGEVLRIIDEEGRNEELGWIVTAMKKLENLPESTSVESSTSQGPERSPSRGTPSGSSVFEAADIRALKDSPPSQPESSLAPQQRDDRISAVVESLPDTLEQFLEDSGDDKEEEDEEEGGEMDSQRLPLDVEDYQSATVSPYNEDVLLSPDTSYSDDPSRSNLSGDAPPGMSENASMVGHQARTRDARVDLPSHEPAVPLSIADSDGRTQPSRQRILDGAENDLSLSEKIMRWLWGEGRTMPQARSNNGGGDDERIVHNLAEEPPFIPVENGRPVTQEPIDTDAEDPAPEPPQEPGQDPEVVAAAAQAGLDPGDAEAVDEAEDLEGIMELVGIQGPLAGLVQNGMFCALLVSLTIFLAIWIPYITGKLFLVFLANPVLFLIKLPLRWASITADLVIDLIIFASSCAYYWTATTIGFLCSPLTKYPPISFIMQGEKLLAGAAKDYAERSLERLAEAFVVTSSSFSESDIPVFSIMAHESLRLLQRRLWGLAKGLADTLAAVAISQRLRTFSLAGIFASLSRWQSYESATVGITSRVALLAKLFYHNAQRLMTAASSLAQVNPLRVSLSIPQRTRPLDFSLADWDTRDRALAILFGYALFALIGILYLQINYSIQGRPRAAKVDGVVADVLYQAGGVMKVILIISIEMIVFPLYCGILLDVALLPLFSHVTFWSRLEFMATSPYTSLFMHWFAGTCYMFHFALFVSMCRKLMRRGVLYFIRDPDDPTFHPVRDVLERSVFTQLWKIAFSAMVYGGLVIVCLGGVVWGIYLAFDGVLPIHWSSNEPVLEFPVDLLFYNFFMPFVVKFFRPADGLYKVFSWWFRKCARSLRLSHFLFGERRQDEEGRHVRRTWNDVFSGKKGDVQKPVTGTDRKQLVEDGALDAYFLRDGRYVRTPASDQVRIPKGAHTFLEVDEDGNRTDGKPENETGSLHSRNSDQFTKVYIPPHFRLRIGAFIFLIWCFAAIIGVGITVIPLVFGRHVFARIFPSHLRMNDVYAFSIGINILGGAIYALLNARRIVNSLRRRIQPPQHLAPLFVFQKTLQYTIRFIRVLYTYTAFVFLLPTLLTLLTEFYLFIPLHTYFGTSNSDPHIIPFIQDWTLGVLYTQAITRLILWHAESRPAIALRFIIRRGWLDPDVKVATRGFIFPATALITFLLVAPLALGWLATPLLSAAAAKDEMFRYAVYRYSYPGVLGLAMGIAFLRLLAKAFRGWKARIRDEVYLIGERLHNFGERRAAVRGTTRVGI
ncbi:MAG: hypothetical protein Q9190_006574 [Brigantiaea leucoxantha]